jgi:hypothetical protein
VEGGGSFGRLLLGKGLLFDCVLVLFFDFGGGLIESFLGGGLKVEFCSGILLLLLLLGGLFPKGDFISF